MKVFVSIHYPGISIAYSRMMYLTENQYSMLQNPEPAVTIATTSTHNTRSQDIYARDITLEHLPSRQRNGTPSCSLVYISLVIPPVYDIQYLIFEYEDK